MKKLDFHSLKLSMFIPYHWITNDKRISWEVIYSLNGDNPLALYGCFGNINSETFYQIQQFIKSKIENKNDKEK